MVAFMKKLVAFFLTLTMAFSLVVPAFAADKETASSASTGSTSFTDAEGKLNTVNISIPQVGSSHVEYYIDNVLINTVDVTIPNLVQTRSISNSLQTGSVSNIVNISYTDMKTHSTQQFTKQLSDYITNGEVSTSPITRASASYIYQGRINFKTFYDDFGDSHTDKLSIYQQTGETTYEYKTINAAEGTLASLAIGVIAAALTVFCPALAVVSTDLFYAAVYAVGTSIIAGKVQGAITKKYYVRTTAYNIKARDLATSRDRVYDAERYQTALDGGGYSSEYYYDGYLPWKSSTVAFWMFSDFWGYTFPGVSSYS